MKLYYKRKCKGAVGSTVNIVKSKVGVKRQRLEELEALKEQLEHKESAQPLILKAVNFDEEEMQHLERLEITATSFEIGEASWKETVGIFSSKDPMDALLLKLKADELLDVERSIISLSFMKNCPVTILSKADTPAAKAAVELTAGTMKVFQTLEEVADYVKNRIPRILQLRDVVQEDIAKMVEQYKKVNVVKHFGKRAAVALVPFAVSAVNFAGLLRLIKRMMAKTGMVVNKEVAKTVGKHSAVATVQALAIDEVGDLYQYAVAATIVADLGSALFSEGVSAALATLDAVDFVLLGSVSFVTGTLSALGAYFTRPQLVDAISKFLATLQVIYLLNPEMRRKLSEEDEAAEDGSSEASDVLDESDLSQPDIPLLEDHDRINPSDMPQNGTQHDTMNPSVMPQTDTQHDTTIPSGGKSQLDAPQLLRSNGKRDMPQEVMEPSKVPSDP